MVTLKARWTRFPIAVLALACLALTACERDNDGPSVNPKISFAEGPGYTYMSDTVGMQDTLLVGVTVRKGDDHVHTFKVLSSYDGAPDVVVDSLPIGIDLFEFDKMIVTRNVAGTEKWTFWVRESDGDVMKRSLTFVVQ